jgi:two-component system sensor histidine kinase CpxA
MAARFPLYARILCWFFLNVGVLSCGLYLALRSGRAGDWLIMQQAEPRLQSVSRLLVQELQPLPREDWTAVLRKYSEAYGMQFAVFSPSGRQLAGDILALPGQVRARVMERPAGFASIPQPGAPPGGAFQPAAPGRPGAPAGRPQQPGLIEPRGPVPEPPLPPLPPPAGAPSGPGGGRGVGRGIVPGQPGLPRQDIDFAKFLERTDDPPAWWFVIKVPLRMPERQGGSSLVLRTESLAAGGLLLDFTPWIWGGVGLLVLSSLLWFPFVRGITRNVSSMKNAAARIAEGQFDVQVPDKRRDELGELAGGINRMAARLSGFVSGQKRFLGDIAHELCTPLARMQMAGAALEQRAPDELKERVADLTVEVEAMSQLVGELLDFSRAGFAPQSVSLSDVPLLALIGQVAAREGVPPEHLAIHVQPELSVRANAGLLARALANVVRNAMRYAGPQADIEISARSADDGDAVLLTISDNGPGVPDGALANLFDPFFRLDAARDRESGGTGLGLAIVKTCIEACGGSVTAGNGSGAGLEVRFRLPRT